MIFTHLLKYTERAAANKSVANRRPCCQKFVASMGLSYACSPNRERHTICHISTPYQNAAAIFTIDPVEMIGGDLPRKERRLVEAWAEMHVGELLENWERLQSGRLPFKVASLR